MVKNAMDLVNHSELKQNGDYNNLKKYKEGKVE